MARVPRRLLQEYSRAITRLSDNAQMRVLAGLEAIDMSDISRARDEIIELLNAVLGPYSEMAAEVSAQFYEAVRGMSIPTEYTADLVTGRLEDATDGFVRAAMQEYVDGKPIDQFRMLVASRAGYETKRASDYCIMSNSANDRQSRMYTRVASGFDNCDFCLMLSSKGPVRVTNVAPDMRAHIHNHCKCVLVPYFKGQTIAGYSQRQAYDDWNAALDAKAKEAAERKGTTVEEERRRILSYYEASAERAKTSAKV